MILGQNWKTTLSGYLTWIGTALLGVTAFTSAVSAWANHQPVDWRFVIITTILAIVGAGLKNAKDDTTHSIPAQILAAEAVAKAATPAQVEQAQVQVKQADAQAEKKG